MSIEFDPTKTREVKSFLHDEQFLLSRFSGSGRYVFGTTLDKLILRCDLATGEITYMPGHQSWVEGLACQTEGNLLFSGDYWGVVHCWQYDAAQPPILRTIHMAQDGIVRDMALTPDGQTLLTCGRDRIARAWRADDFTLLHEFKGHKDDIYSLAVSPDGFSLVTGDQLGVVKHWDINSGKLVRDLDASALWSDPYKNGFVDMGGVRKMSFDADGKRLGCAGMFKGTSATFSVGQLGILELDFGTGNEIRRMEPQGGGFIKGIRYLTDGTLVTAAEGPHGRPTGGLWFWAPGATEPLHHDPKFKQAHDLDVHPDGLHLTASHFEASGHGGNGKRPGDYYSNNGSLGVYQMAAAPVVPKS